MTAGERAWLDAYHAHVRDLLSPLLGAQERDWLARAQACEAAAVCVEGVCALAAPAARSQIAAVRIMRAP